MAKCKGMAKVCGEWSWLLMLLSIIAVSMVSQDAFASSRPLRLFESVRVDFDLKEAFFFVRSTEDSTLLRYPAFALLDNEESSSQERLYYLSAEIPRGRQSSSMIYSILIVGKGKNFHFVEPKAFQPSVADDRIMTTDGSAAILRDLQLQRTTNRSTRDRLAQSNREAEQQLLAILGFPQRQNDFDSLAATQSRLDSLRFAIEAQQMYLQRLGSDKAPPDQSRRRSELATQLELMKRELRVARQNEQERERESKARAREMESLAALIARENLPALERELRRLQEERRSLQESLERFPR